MLAVDTGSCSDVGYIRTPCQEDSNIVGSFSHPGGVRLGCKIRSLIILLIIISIPVFTVTIRAYHNTPVAYTWHMV